MNTEDWKAKLGAAFNVEVPTANAENDTEDTQPAGDALQQQGKGMVDIMLDKRNRNGIPYLIHNSGQPRREEDALLRCHRNHPISGHYRWQGGAAG